MKNLILANNWGAYCYRWANNKTTSVMHPQGGALLADHFDKIILINGVAEEWLFHPAFAGKNAFFFLWDPARCPHYAPSPALLARLKRQYRVYSFQESDCADFGLRFNSTMYAPPPPDLIPPQPLLYDVLFLGVPKDRLPLLRNLHRQLLAQGLRPNFQIALTQLDNGLQPEEADGWRITYDWVDYPDYLRWVQQSRAILDLYQSIQTGFSLRVMEHIFFGKKLITNNAVIRQAVFYHPNNIFLLERDGLEGLTDWLKLPFVPIAQDIKDYYKFENWAERFL